MHGSIFPSSSKKVMEFFQQRLSYNASPSTLRIALLSPLANLWVKRHISFDKVSHAATLPQAPKKWQEAGLWPQVKQLVFSDVAEHSVSKFLLYSPLFTLIKSKRDFRTVWVAFWQLKTTQNNKEINYIHMWTEYAFFFWSSDKHDKHETGMVNSVCFHINFAQF